jgi:hypothetical protein
LRKKEREKEIKRIEENWVRDAAKKGVGGSSIEMLEDICPSYG